jgi:hypothetical protein
MPLLKLAHVPKSSRSVSFQSASSDTRRILRLHRPSLRLHRLPGSTMMRPLPASRLAQSRMIRSSSWVGLWHVPFCLGLVVPFVRGRTARPDLIIARQLIRVLPDSEMINDLAHTLSERDGCDNLSRTSLFRGSRKRRPESRLLLSRCAGFQATLLGVEFTGTRGRGSAPLCKRTLPPPWRVWMANSPIVSRSLAPEAISGWCTTRKGMT